MANEFIIKNGLIVQGGGAIISGSVTVIGGITGSVSGSMENATSASFAATASFLQGSIESASYALTASFLQGSVDSASFATTASYLQGSVTSASYSELSRNADTASFVQLAVSSSYVKNAESASFVITAQTASFYGGSVISSSFASTASFVTLAQTSSFVELARSASYVQTAQTASYVTTAQTASFLNSTASWAASSSVAIRANTASFYAETDPIFNSRSGSLATTGSNIFTGTQTLRSDLVVTSSIFISHSIFVGKSTSLATVIPAFIDMGGSFATFPSSSGAKWKLYSDGVSANIYGIGITAAQFNHFTVGGASYRWYFGDRERLNFASASLSLSASLLVSGGLVDFSRATSVSGTITNSTSASYVQTAQTASYFGGVVQSASFSEQARNADTASFIQLAQSASYVKNAETASYFGGTIESSSFASNARSASQAETASFVRLANSASYVQTAQTASFVALAQSASFAEQSRSGSFSQLARSSSYSDFNRSSSFAELSRSGSFSQLARSSSFAESASFSQSSRSGSYSDFSRTGSFAELSRSGSFSELSRTASYSITASHALNGGGGGISNSAIVNEIMKSDGTNAVSSGLFVPNLGRLHLSGASIGGTSASGSLVHIKGFEDSVTILSVDTFGGDEVFSIADAEFLGGVNINVNYYKTLFYMTQTGSFQIGSDDAFYTFTTGGLNVTNGFIKSPSFTGSFTGSGAGLTGVVASAAPGGPNKSVQFNQDSATSGSGNFTYNAETNVLQLAGSNTGLLMDVQIAETSSRPPAGTILMYGKNVSGKMVMKTQGPSGFDTPLQSAIWQNNFVLWSPINGTNVGQWIGTIGTGSGVFTTVVPTASLQNAALAIKRAAHATLVTTQNQTVGIRQNEVMFFRGVSGSDSIGGFFFAARVVLERWRTGDRLFVGFGSASNSFLAADPSAQLNMCGFGVNAGSSSIEFMSNDGTSTATRIPIANQPLMQSGSGYDFYIYAKASDVSTIYYRMDSLTSGSTTIVNHSTSIDLPISTSLMSVMALMSNGANTVVGDARIAINRIYVETDM